MIDNILVDEQVASTAFSCDLANCKGACCTFPGENGAPLLDSELSLVSENLAPAKKYLSERSRDIIDKQGWYEGVSGEYTTRCIDKKDCVFVYYDGDVAKCAIEKAYFNGESAFRKPISCHLFPIRVGEYGGPYLYYEEFHVCGPGRKKGQDKRILLHNTVKDAIIRAYGEDFYGRLAAYSEENYGEAK